MCFSCGKVELNNVIVDVNNTHTIEAILAIIDLFIRIEKAYIKVNIKIQISIDLLVLKFIKIYLQNLKINNFLNYNINNTKIP